MSKWIPGLLRKRQPFESWKCCNCAIRTREFRIHCYTGRCVCSNDCMSCLFLDVPLTNWIKETLPYSFFFVYLEHLFLPEAIKFFKK
jgi:hypothetical protein